MTEAKSSLGIKYSSLRDHPLKTSLQWLENRRMDDNAENLWRIQDKPPVSSLRITPLPNRHTSQNGPMWLKDRARIDGAEGYWRIHGDLYDLGAFIKEHPGGAEWLELTKGTDCTEAFEVHHLSNKPQELLKKFLVKKAKTPRTSPFTFNDNGFYRTLKRRVMEVLPTTPKQPINTSAFFTDALLCFVFVFSILAVSYWSYLVGVLAGFFLGCTTIASHNYFHKRDNFRMHYFNFSLMQVTEWRISHILSHHLHTNTIDDMEITQNEPLFHYLPEKKKTTWMKYGPWLYFPIVWIIAFHINYLKRVSYILKGDRSLIQWYDFIPYILPVVMYSLGGQGVLATLWMWNFIVFAGSFHFAIVGVNAAHHHPDIFHDGDTPRQPINGDMDWGISQLDAIMDRNEITGSHFLVLTNFGDHALHHMFPTLDHGTLEYLYPVFEEVCKEFGVKLRFNSQLAMVKGQFQQLIRTEANPNPPNLFKTY